MKTALVTGASRGIGRAVAERLARDGFRIAVNYARNTAAANDVVSAITDTGGSAFAVRAELGVPGAIDAMFEQLDKVDVLVNNAAIGLPLPIEDVTEAGFAEVFAVNVKDLFFLTRRALPLMPEGGRIVNITSGATRIAFPEGIAYAMTKGAIEVFTLALAKQLGPRGITVNNVAPGIVDTDANAGWLRDNPQAEAQAAARHALGRVGHPNDIADVVAFAASDQARWITGTTLDATGGAEL